MEVTLITNPLSSEEMHSFGQHIGISYIISLSSSKLHVPFYRWRIVVRVTYLRVKVCNCQICFISLWRICGPTPKIRYEITKELVVHSVFPVELRWIHILARKKNIITWSARPGLWGRRMLIRVGFFKNQYNYTLTSDLRDSYWLISFI